MAENKEYIARAAAISDDKYIIGVTALAPMVEISKNNLRFTGKEEATKIYDKDNILSSDLMNGEITSIKALEDDERGK